MEGVRHTTKLSHPGLKVTRFGGLCRKRAIHVISGTCVRRKLCVNDPDIGTLESALLERMYFCKIAGKFVPALEPDKIKLQSRLSEFRKQLIKLVGYPTPRTTDEVVECYQGRKRKMYENANLRLKTTGVRRKHAFSVVFGKAEKVDPSKAPRCINPRRAEYNLALGKFLKFIEKRVYRAIDSIFGGPTVMSGYDVCQVGQHFADAWDQFIDPVAVGLDATKFDMHVHEVMLKWEHSIYLALYNHDPELKKYLSWQVDNQGYGFCQDGKLRFSVRGKRFSGDLNTAMGNKIIMTGMVFAFCNGRVGEYRLLNNGDDCVVIMERADVDKFSYGLDEWFAEMGFRMTVEKPVYHLEQIEFCQMHPIRTARGWTMVRNIDTAREKDSMCLKNLDTESAMRKWLGAIGECGLALCSGVPILQAMYSMYLRNGEASRMRYDPCLDTGMSRMRGGLDSVASEILPETRAQVFSAWNITPEEQIAIEDMYESSDIEFGMNCMSLRDIPVSVL